MKRKREHQETQIEVATGGKKKITTEAVNALFGIKESFELPEMLLKKLLNKEEKNKLCSEFMRFDFNINNDCLRDYFQENNANRNNLKQDYTPDCLCRLISEIVPKTEKIIDICSGTGALTIGMNRKIIYQCEELSQMSIPILLFNLVLRGINATVFQKDVLLNKTEKAYRIINDGDSEFGTIEVFESCEETKTDVVISNPPYSLKWTPNHDSRFDGYELAPAKASDYAFVLDGISRLTETGQAFFILPHGVLFRGNAEGKIRQQLIENNLIDAVISLPENMFLNTSIPVIVLVINKAKQTNDVLFIQAGKLFEKNGKQNVMNDEQIKKIADAYWGRQTIEKFSKVVSLLEIKQNDYNLNVPRYIDTFEREEIPPLGEIINDLIKTDLEAKKATDDLLNMLKELYGDDDYNELKESFVDYFKKQDVVGDAMITWMSLKNLEKKVDWITRNAKKERISLYDIASFERVKKGKIYEAGTVYIQLSATDGKVRFLTENKELETKYGVFIPKSKNLGTRYLYYMLVYEMEEFLSRYQNGMNINPDIFKYLKITYYHEYKFQRELVSTLDSIDFWCNSESEKVQEYQFFKKYHLDGMFCN